ncbi:MAG: peptide chain release factor aRF-1 [Nanoarchaeota archaeon]|nr:peptide chain release factor aRF-1 [Nanoarchaeota archaeon]MBU4451810.1 peptide chain release factor aRF-1 [Nanoarchaeota archaeon]
MRGRHTDLVSIYIPKGYNINEIRNLVFNEAATAENIKSRTTRKNVTTALERAGQKLKNYKVTPENGLAILCGNISENEGQTDMRIWEIIPPEPVTTRIYRCDQTFVLEPLQDMIRERENYGLISIDTHEATVAFLRGKAISVAVKKTSHVPGKQRKGGQSSIRFSRIREEILFKFMKDFGDLVNKTFEVEKDIVGIIVGGPGQIKDEFVNGNFLFESVKKKILGIKDTGYAGEDGLRELVERSSDILKEASVMKEKEILNKFFEHLKKDTRLVTYGFLEVEKAMSIGAVDTLIVSEGFEFKAYSIKCTACSHEDEIVKRAEHAPTFCPKCSAQITPDEIDVFAKLEELAKNTGAKFELVSVETQEGAQFIQLGGIGAILRYVVE